MNSSDTRRRIVIDIGNTHIVIGEFIRGALSRSWRLTTRKSITSDEAVMDLNGIFGEGNNSLGPVEAAALASVVPRATFQWIRALEKKFHVPPRVVTAAACTSFKIMHDLPEQVGADRLCNILACQALGLTEAVIIDMGTATTFDVFFDNTYAGGVICPGILSGMEYLTEKTSKLQDVDLFWNTTIIARNTDDAVRNGLLFGSAGQIDAIVQKILKESGMHAPAIIATGGLAELVRPGSSLIQKTDKNLTLTGLHHFIALSENAGGSV